MVADFINKHAHIRNAFVVFCLGFAVTGLASKQDPFAAGLLLCAVYSVFAGLDTLHRRMTGPEYVTIKNQPKPKQDT
jgi:hypothetical protein